MSKGVPIPVLLPQVLHRQSQALALGLQACGVLGLQILELLEKNRAQSSQKQGRGSLHSSLSCASFAAAFKEPMRRAGMPLAS